MISNAFEWFYYFFWTNVDSIENSISSFFVENWIAVKGFFTLVFLGVPIIVFLLLLILFLKDCFIDFIDFCKVKSKLKGDKK